MNNKYLWVILLFFIVLFAGAYLYNKDKRENLDQERQAAIEEESQRPSVTLNIKHQYKDGTHLIVGLLELPTPCDQITTNVTKNTGETIVDINYSSGEEICAQVITEKEFRISFAGSADENIIAKLNGELINLNLFEIDPTKNIDEVEIFNKG
jgi:cbb3-type cytochrome oxidase subunit 3